MSGGNPAGETKLAALVARQIEDDVIARGWPVGTVLGSESELVERYGVSRAVLREAVRIVEHHFVATMRRGPGGGLVVTAPDVEGIVRAVTLQLEYQQIEPHHVHEARVTLELACVRLAAQRLTAADVQSLREQKEIDRTASGRAQNFHVWIAQFTGNPALALFVSVLSMVMRDYLDVPESAGRVTAELNKAHRAIAEALVARDAQRAERLMFEHLEHVKRWIRPAVSRVRRRGVLVAEPESTTVVTPRTILVSSEVVRLREPLARRLDGMPVVLADVGSGPAEVLLVAQEATDDVRAGLRAGVHWIQSLATGVETVLIPEVIDSDIVVTNSAGTTAGPVTEFTFARMLEHAKRLRYIADRQREHAWDRFMHDALEGSTVAVIGLGPIGRRVVSIAKAFGMTVLGVRRRPDAGAEGCDAVYGPVQLPEVMAMSDFVVLLAALTPATRGLVDRRALQAAKPGCLIINVGRAELLDHDALLDATRDGRVSAALDVVPEEPLPPDSPLWDTPGISISSHIAVWTPVLMEAILDLVLENVERFVEGRPLLNVVDKQLGYPVS